MQYRIAGNREQHHPALSKNCLDLMFFVQDKLIPIITLVIYFGADPWDAPRSIYDMLSVQDQTLLSYIPDYKINLIAPFDMSDEEINQFSTNLREVMLYLKYSKDKIKLSEIVSTNENFSHMDIKAARVINGITGSNFKWNDNEEEIADICDLDLETVLSIQESLKI